MLKTYNTDLKADLRKRNSFTDEIQFSSYDIKACMVILAVFTVLLLSVISVVTAQNPSFIY